MTRHICTDVFDVNPREVCGGRPVGLAWFSPDCKHFSKAKGGKPVSKKIRGLAWVAVRWAEAVRPRIIILENVEEFQTWGPLLENGMPCPDRKGQTFRAFIKRFEKLGYDVEWRELRGCDYGAGTIRKRLFVVMRCDGRPIIWPRRTHGEGLIPWVTAADCIDFDLPCPSIFGRKKPLQPNTMRRIAAGVFRYVIDNPSPFILNLTHGGRLEPINQPLRTITCAQRGEKALVMPTLVTVGYGEAPGQKPRVPGLHKPLGTIVTSGKHALVAAFLAQHNTERKGVKAGRALDVPVSTVTASGSQQNLVMAHMMKMRGTNIGHGLDEPLHTITSSGHHHFEVRAFLMKYYGTDQDPRIDQPLHTITTVDRFGLVMVQGAPYQIVDIGMRMLTPRELARAQGFPESHVIDRLPDGKLLTKKAQVRMIGNSVCPPVAQALAAANWAGSEIF